MKKVYKYQLDVGFNTLHLPKGAELLHVGYQNGYFDVWTLVITDEELEVRTILGLATGEVIPDNAKYIGTVSVNNYREVYHFFEV